MSDLSNRLDRVADKVRKLRELIAGVEELIKKVNSSKARVEL